MTQEVRGRQAKIRYLLESRTRYRPTLTGTQAAAGNQDRSGSSYGCANAAPPAARGAGSGARGALACSGGQKGRSREGGAAKKKVDRANGQGQQNQAARRRKQAGKRVTGGAFVRSHGSYKQDCI